MKISRWNPLIFVLLVFLAPSVVAQSDGTLKNEEFVLGYGLSIFYPQNWEVGPKMYSNAFEIHARSVASPDPDEESSRQRELRSYSRILITFEQRRNHEEALGRLREIVSERPEPAKFSNIAGWSALTRIYHAPLPKIGKEDSYNQIDTTWTTTAVAVDALLVRFDSTLALDSPAEFVQQAIEIAESLTSETTRDPKDTDAETKALQEFSPRSMSVAIPPVVSLTRYNILRDKFDTSDLTAGAAPGTPGAVFSVQAGVGELEIAVTDDGQNIVVGANSGYSFSNDGGLTWTFGGGTPALFPRNGDPSLAVGASDNFYYGFIGFPNGSVASGGVTGCSTGISRSTDNGATFPFVNHAVLCTNAGATQCFPDQEHIGSDRDNAAPGGGDEVYSVWRNFAPSGAAWTSCLTVGAANVTPSIVCSQDDAANWTAPAAVGAGDYPRISVASDGFVYAVYRSGNNIMLNKYNACSAGLTQQAGFPVTVAAAVPNVTCPVPGLDRCNNGNHLRSMTVVADDTNANHIYVAYATTSVAGNENIVVKDSIDGGLTWPNATTINSATTARRFMPWICSVTGAGIVSWFDRSAATAANNDFTDYYVGGASAQGSNLVAHIERNLSVNADPSCASGWPCAPRSSNDSESCSVQPQFAGRCRSPGGGGSLNVCDFSASGCPVGETCTTGGGCPKYGDYNGNACISNRIYTAWASATAPPGLPAPGGLTVYSAVTAVSDFYVRDWTDSPASGDNGAEPSTHANFYSTSDVWNRRGGTNPGAFVNDQPENEDAGNGVGNIGDNWAFARIRRNTAPPTGDALVTAHFLVSKLGTGSNYVDVSSADPDVSFTDPDPTILFNAADLGPTTTIGYPWHLNAITSSHLCLAVEISSVGDAFIAPSLLGYAPGWPTTDQKVLADNNKAQRNMGLSTTPARGSAGAAGFWAIAHNAATFTRDMVIRVDATDRVFSRLESPMLSIIGERQRLFKPGDQIVLKGMSPGENRWLGVVFPAPKGKAGEVLTVQFTEQVEEQSVNGFSLGVRLADNKRLARDGLELHRSVMTRLDLGFNVKGAGELSKIAEHLLSDEQSGAKEYTTYIREYYDQIHEVILQFLKHSKINLFDTRDSLKLARKQGRNGELHEFSVIYGTLLNKVDSLATLTQISIGDAADISQTVRWQHELAEIMSTSRKSACAARLSLSSKEFARDYSLRRIGNRDYPGFLQKQLDCMTALANDLELNLDKEVSRISESIKLGSPQHVQGAHRNYLLKLASTGELSVRQVAD